MVPLASSADATSIWCKKSDVDDFDGSDSRRRDEAEQLALQRRGCAAYFRALRAGDGDAAAVVFARDGVLDDLMGGQHVGREQIKSFIDDRPPLLLEESLHVIATPGRVNHYGRIHFDDGVVMKVRWTFTFHGEEVTHLCNSRVHTLLGVDPSGEEHAAGPSSRKDDRC
jgi:hypothetical protein